MQLKAPLFMILISATMLCGCHNVTKTLPDGEWEEVSDTTQYENHIISNRLLDFLDKYSSRISNKVFSAESHGGHVIEDDILQDFLEIDDINQYFGTGSKDTNAQIDRSGSLYLEGSVNVSDSFDTYVFRRDLQFPGMNDFFKTYYIFTVSGNRCMGAEILCANSDGFTASFVKRTSKNEFVTYMLSLDTVVINEKGKVIEEEAEPFMRLVIDEFGFIHTYIRRLTPSN